jgi:DMSO reductase anchor subunit
VVAAGLIKAMYYYWIARSNGPTINTATGFTRARVRLLDPGHTHGTFLTHEFGYQPSATVVKTAKTLVFLLAYVLPLVLLWVAAAAGAGQGLMIAAAVSGLAGAGVERWLFFAEARHVVNLYHGHQTT